jgi:hypothetical protein
MKVRPIAKPHTIAAEKYPASIGLRLGESTTDALVAEAERLGISVEELANFSVLYYLADLDSGRIARTIPPPVHLLNPGGPSPSPRGGLPSVSETP